MEETTGRGARRPVGAGEPGRPVAEAGQLLLVTDDQALVEEVHRLAAGAGVLPRVVDRAAAALAGWQDAGAVLVGADQAADLALLRLPRRPGVHLLALTGPEERDFRHAVELGAESVLDLADASAWLAELMAELVEPRGPGLVLAVVPGSGGAGATTLACALGQVAARRGTALVVDTDPLGAGVDRVLGFDGEPGLGWQALAETSGRLNGSSLREAVPGRERLGILTWGGGPVPPPSPEVLRESLDAARRVHDVVAVDLPRPCTADSEATAAEVVTRSHRVLVVVRPTLVGVAAAARLVAGRQWRPWLVIRGSGLPVAAVEQAVGAPVVLEMADQRGLDESVELGLGPARARRGPLARAAGRLLDDALTDLPGASLPGRVG